MVAVELGLESSDVDKIDYEFPRNPHEKNFHVFYKWKIKNSEADHISRLKEVLREMDRNDVVEDIENFTRAKYTCCEVQNSTNVVADKDLLTVAQELTMDTFRLGRFLGVPQNRMSQIKEDNGSSIVEQCFQILRSWRQSQASMATRQALCDGLVYIKQQIVIDKLNKKWMS
ncbi:hypothetical protein FSP39_006688 [Pinctada imbricata]|uniref:Death domain-containing protein n=1 Tax=Pinctada imbricata TaxID=66713 RepID=A0AA88YUT1_PINIB|nr:hypothetical protein FSP39_006688 [Pinctada imbricata]